MDNSRVVWRYNTNAGIRSGKPRTGDVRQYGARQWEIYQNTFTGQHLARVRVGPLTH